MTAYGSPARGRRIEVLEEEISKGFAPVLARRTAMAGRGARRVITGDQVNARRVVGKSVQGSLGSIGRYQATAGTAVRRKVAGDEPKGLLATRIKAAQQRPVAKASLGGFMTGLRNAGQVARGGFKAGLAQSRGITGAAAKPKLGMGASVASARSKPMGMLGRASMTAGKNPMATGAVAGAGLMGGAGALSGSGPRESPSIYTPPTPMYAGFGKRSYDPENERRFRQGAAATGSGAAGLALGAYAAREGRDATRVARRGAAFGPHAGKLQVIELDNGKGNKISAKLVSQRAVHTADRLKRGGVAITRRGGVAGLGALGALGTSGALVRSRHEERWD